MKRHSERKSKIKLFKGLLKFIRENEILNGEYEVGAEEPSEVYKEYK